MKKRLCLLFILILAFALVACSGTETTQNSDTATGETAKPQQTQAPFLAFSDEQLDSQESKVLAEITMENGGVMEIELYPDLAPITVENFKSLANNGFYDGLTFHRIIEGFMIQGGDPEGTGMGGSKDKIKGEFAANGVENNISHKRGVISMARSQEMDSASSQFFICHEDSDFLDGQYAAFGKMTKGFEVLDELSKTEVIDNNGTVPAAKQPIIKSVIIK